MRRYYLAFVFTLFFTTYTKADSFHFTFNGSVYAGSGTFTATPTAGPSASVPTFLITAVNGTATFNSGTMTTLITGVAAPGTGAQQNDNLLFFPGVNGNDFFDGQGVAFNLANNVTVNLFAYSGIYETIPGRGVLPDSGPITVTAVAPEPPTILLVAGPVLLMLAWRSIQRLSPKLRSLTSTASGSLLTRSHCQGDAACIKICES